MSREKEIYEITRQVQNGQIEVYNHLVDGERVWSLHKGKVDGLGKKDLSYPGWTMVIQGHMSSTQVRTIERQTVIDTALNCEERWPEVKKLKDMTTKYLTSDEGAWGRGS